MNSLSPSLDKFKARSFLAHFAVVSILSKDSVGSGGTEVLGNFEGFLDTNPKTKETKDSL